MNVNNPGVYAPWARPTQPPQQTYPPGWHPPFQGPPPIPAGVNVNPQSWQTGVWQFNPAYNHLQARPPPTSQQAPWVPGNAWYSWSRTQPQSQRPDKQPQQSQQGQAQGQGQAQIQNNPYKRVPKPPSAEYMAMRLSDNPLGLSNMIPRDEIYREKGDGAEHTPWIWNPRGLVEDDDDDSERGIITAEYKDATGRRVHEPRGPIPSRKPHSAPQGEGDQAGMSRESSAGAAPSSYSHRHHGNADRQSSEPIPSSDGRNHNRNPSRHSSEPSSLGRPSASASASVLQPTPTTPYPLPPTDPNRPLDRPLSSQIWSNTSMANGTQSLSNPLYAYPGAPSTTNHSGSGSGSLNGNSYRPPPPPAATSREQTQTTDTGNTHGGAQSHSSASNGNGQSSQTQENIPPPPPADEESSFTSKRVLQTTFTTNIVRTPGHYSSPSRSNSTASNASTPTRRNSAASNSNTTSDLTSQFERLDTRSRSSTTTGTSSLSRQSSLPSSFFSNSSSSSSSMTDATTLVEEPVDFLSPLMLGVATPRPLARGHTVPSLVSMSVSSSLSAIPEATFGYNDSSPSRRSKSKSNAQVSPGTSSSHSYDRRSSEPVGRRSKPNSNPNSNSNSNESSPYASHSDHTNSNSPARVATGTTSQRPPNPLPPPPVDVPYPLASGSGATLSSSVSAANPAASGSGSGNNDGNGKQPSASSHRRRIPVYKGFWNRRGDHLTFRWEVVHAPSDKQYPEQLKDYPKEGEGFRDDFGNWVSGEGGKSIDNPDGPMVRPYESYLQYVYE